MILPETNSAARTLFRSKPIQNSKQDRILGALFGAAVGDVMGSTITGVNSELIKEKYGQWGISAPPYNSFVSHNFQLTLFALDAIINCTQKSQKLSIKDIAHCLTKCVKEWEKVVNNPNLFHGINHLADKNAVCTDFMKNYPLWRFKRPGLKNKNDELAELINPLLLAVLLCANQKTSQEVFNELVISLGKPTLQIDTEVFGSLFSNQEIITKQAKIDGLNKMCEKINSSSRPDLMGMIAGFEHGAKYGINAFKQIWYLRIDAMNLCEQMGWRVGRAFKSS
ncbi:MAG: ADP-ribosylglycohydrolase family protein [Actinomycetes bacterium]